MKNYFSEKRQLPRTRSRRFMQLLCAGLLLVTGLNALGGGIYGMIFSRNLPLEWLAGSPFRSYFIPSLFLLVAVGGSTLLSSIFIFTSHRSANVMVVITCSILLLWIIAQVSLIGLVSWLQPAIAIIAVLVLLLWSLGRRLHAV